MNTEQATKLFAALQEIKPITKDKTNPHYKSRYADINNILEDVKPIIHKHGLFILQPITDHQIFTNIYDGSTGDILVSASMELNTSLSPQQRGSEITYYRRYLLQSLLCLEAIEDDDGNATTTAPSVELPWLNIMDKNGNPNDKYNEIEQAIASGKQFTLKAIKTKYRVSKQVQEQLKTKFNIL
jgi:hypothetical protein